MAQLINSKVLNLSPSNSKVKCIRCLFSDFFNFSIFGTLCITGTCKHFGNFAKCKFAVSRFRIFLTIVCLVFLTQHILTLIYLVYTGKFNFVNALKDIVGDSVAGSTACLHMYYVSNFKEMFEFMQEVMNKSCEFHLSHDIDTMLRKIRGIVRVILFLSPGFFIGYLGLVIVHGSGGCSIYLSSYAALYRAYVMVIHMIIISMNIMILRTALQFSLKSLYSWMKLKKQKIDSQNDISKLSTNGNGGFIVEKIQFYFSVVKLFRIFSTVYSGILLAMFMIYLPDLSMNLYTMIITQTFFHPRYALCMILGAAITIVLAIGQTIVNASDEILSFLFKYPISKLSPVEAAQVELLILTLTLQRPGLRASDIFTLGARLLASISGTVVTYVLVALQFHSSWAD